MFFANNQVEEAFSRHVQSLVVVRMKPILSERVEGVFLHEHEHQADEHEHDEHDEHGQELEHDEESNKHGKQDHEFKADEKAKEKEALQAMIQHDEHEQQAEDPGEVFLMVEHEEHDEHGREFHKESEMIVTDEAMETMMERLTQSYTEKMDKMMAKQAEDINIVWEKGTQELKHIFLKKSG